MPVFQLTKDLLFPPPEMADPDGLLAVGGDASPERLVLAYGQGIFPWPSEDLPLLWFSPDPRFVLPLGQVHIPRSTRKALARRQFTFSFDTRFDEVIEACAAVPRPGQDGTWITSEMMDGYKRLHEAGLAHSVETYADGELVGGLYGVSLGSAFFGESMFARRPEASKAAFATLIHHLHAWDFSLLDCQARTDHLARFGAVDVSRSDFLQSLHEALTRPTRSGTWSWDERVVRETGLPEG